MTALDLAHAARLVEDAAKPHYRGRVEVVSGVMVEAEGVPAALGELPAGAPLDFFVLAIGPSRLSVPAWRGR